MKETATLDRLYLEWSQFTTARTQRELQAARMVRSLRQVATDNTVLVPRRVAERLAEILEVLE